jgi:Secretion system C-terminal sorting domain
MRKCLLLILCTLVLSATNSQDLRSPKIITGLRTCVTPDLHNWKPDFNDPILKIKTRDEKGLIFARNKKPLQWTNYGSKHSGNDPVWQKKSNVSAAAQNNTLSISENSSIERNGSTLVNDFQGLGFTNIAPGDPTIAVGPNHILQMVNGQNGSAFFRIFSKNGGALSLEAYMDQLPGSSYNGAGDCIPWYDQLADRYIMTEFGDSMATGTNVNTLIFAVSKTNDPLGSWYVYEFSDPNFFPDYPKYGTWHDAWYGMTRDFIGGYVGNSVYAYDRSKMLTGALTATVQRFRFSDQDNKFNSLTTVSLIGNTPAPAGTPGFFLFFNDDNYTASATDTDSVGIITLKVDFANPANSVARVEQTMPVAPFKSNVCDNRNCAPSPTGAGYDVISSRFMNRPYYRNFGTHQAIVANHTVDVTGTAVSGLRWYEMRKTTGPWSIYQQSTFSPQTLLPCSTTAALHRFFGAISINSKGQVALAYNSSSSSRFVTLSFTGRNENDPLNLMSYEETDATISSGYGTFGNRWGDYNELVPDLSNDSIFWFTAMYGTGATTWGTRIISFKFGENINLDAKLVAIENPSSCSNTCTPDVTPQIRFKNLGTSTLSTLKINMSVNGGPVSTTTWTGTLNISEETSFALPLTTLPLGPSTIKIFLTEPNGATDENPLNDSTSVNVNIGTGSTLPLSEGFENPTFPPPGWSQSSSIPAPGFNWERYTNAGHSGIASIKFDNYNLNLPNQFSDFRTPLLDANTGDSMALSFWVAAAIFDNSSQDTLEVLVSTDCGNSYTSVYKKWGPELATRAGFVQTEFTPALESDWRQEFVNLNSFVGQGEVVVVFRNINRFGNNIYLDDINITKGFFLARDVAIVNINEPFDFVCVSPFTPNVSFVNLGKETLQSVKINYRIDGGPIQTTSWTGSLARLESASIDLPEANPSAGRHNFRVFSSEPNGLTDDNMLNDSARRSFNLKEDREAPISEGFEDASFPPAQWDRLNPDDAITWQLTRGASFEGIASIYINNYSYPQLGQTDEMVSPVVRYADVDSVYVSFQLAASTYSYPGSTGIPLDTLEVLISTDCGKSFISVYKKWGSELQTINRPNDPNTSEFVPRSANDWRKELINLTSLLGKSNSFLVVFRNTNNFENNIFLDDINIYTKTLPAKLKNNGYMISPNPFTNSFVIQLFPNANNLKGIEIYNAVGQLVYRRNITVGTADATQEIDMSRMAAGMYSVRLLYTDRAEFERVIKLR